MRIRANKNNMGDYITLSQACEINNAVESTIRRLAKEAGAVRKIGKSYRINRAVLHDYIEREDCYIQGRH